MSNLEQQLQNLKTEELQNKQLLVVALELLKQRNELLWYTCNENLAQSVAAEQLLDAHILAKLAGSVFRSN